MFGKKTDKLVTAVDSKKHSGVFTIPAIVGVITLVVVLVAGLITWSVVKKDTDPLVEPDFSKIMTITEDDGDTGISYVYFYPKKQLLKATYHHFIIPLHASDKVKHDALYRLSKALASSVDGNSIVRVMVKPKQIGELGAVLAFQQIADNFDAKDTWDFLNALLNAPEDVYMDVDKILNLVDVDEETRMHVVNETYQVRGLRAVRNMNKLYAKKNMDNDKYIFYSTRLDD